MGDVKAGNRRRAVGTRDRVMSYLVAVGEIRDASGMDSNVLAEAVAYPGSSIAFAQLLSGMERSGLIEREVRGKRTYRIAPAEAAAAQVTAAQVRAAQAAARTHVAAPRQSRRPVAAGAVSGRTVTARRGEGLVVAAKGVEDFDYDELARRLLVQVLQRLAASSGPGPAPSAAGMAEPAGTGPEDAVLARTVASLEHKLASVRSRQRRLTEENAKLREQLRAAQESLAQAEEQADAGRSAGQLDSAEVRLLERLLSPLREKGDRREEAGAS